DLKGGATVTLDARLAPRTVETLVVVRTRPVADIAIDGRPIGRAPLQARVDPGSHELVATASGYEADHVAMALSAGDRRDLDLVLEKPPPITSRWWFWTGIAVVVAGGVATTIALTTERSPDRGTFSPGKIPGP